MLALNNDFFSSVGLHTNEGTFYSTQDHVYTGSSPAAGLTHFPLKEYNAQETSCKS